MFAVVNYSVKVGNEASRAEERLRGHEETLDVLEDDIGTPVVRWQQECIYQHYQMEEGLT
jgi:hypothetical protein